ncbi:MAG: adenylyltransferase/cytidyltransferase family protein [Acidobacteria bacterium]|nr:adenylyltransferase/cytidyltransferase family protein [Acidobacteriota bacterium]
MVRTAAAWIGFDDPRSSDVRFLEEAARLGSLRVWLASDEALAAAGRPSRFPEAERAYFLRSIRHVDEVRVARWRLDAAPDFGPSRPTWVVGEDDDSPELRARCRAAGVQYHVVRRAAMTGFPPSPAIPLESGQARVIATGCFDWLHSGHVRFFEEASRFGHLHVIVGHDENVRMLKGPGHPMLPAEERRYMVGAIRAVHRALVSTGRGWVDAEPEIADIRPDVYVVNEDGDRREKREFCAHHGIRYVVLSRRPQDGLPRRTSTELRRGGGER